MSALIAIRFYGRRAAGAAPAGATGDGSAASGVLRTTRARRRAGAAAACGPPRIHQRQGARGCARA